MVHQKQIKRMSEDDKMDALNEIWQNFCVSSTYEPGSVQNRLRWHVGWRQVQSTTK